MERIDYGQLAREIILDLLGRGMTHKQIRAGSGVSMTTLTSITQGHDTTPRTYARLRAYAQKLEETMTTDTDVTIAPVEGPRDELHNHYRDQSSPQGVYLEVRPEDHAVTVDWNGEIGNAVPMNVWHGRELRYGLHGVPTPEAANSFMARVLPLVRRICAGHESEWDGSNWVGRLTTPDAEAASEELTSLCEDREFCADDHDGLAEWEPADWFGEVIEERGARADSTDQELDTLAEKLRCEALNEYIVVYGIRGWLDDVRERLIEAAEPEE